MFSGLSAFPITPVDEDGIDEAAFALLVERAVKGGADSICALGSTGNYLYLNRDERAQVVKVAVDAAGGIPVLAGIGALRSRDVLLLAEDACRHGASGLLLAPVSYHRLAPDEVFRHFELIARYAALPICVYDNPEATRFEFSDELHGRIAALPNVRSIKIPPVSMDVSVMRARVDRLREGLPKHVTIGISGDSFAGVGLAAGCDAWYSVIGGIFPKTAHRIVGAARACDAAELLRLSERLSPLWKLFDKYQGSLRVVAAAAVLAGLVRAPALPLPLRPIAPEDVEALAAVIDRLQLE